MLFVVYDQYDRVVLAIRVRLDKCLIAQPILRPSSSSGSVRWALPPVQLDGDVDRRRIFRYPNLPAPGDEPSKTIGRYPVAALYLF